MMGEVSENKFLFQIHMEYDRDSGSNIISKQIWGMCVMNVRHVNTLIAEMTCDRT
jgi:hypothetical protein